MANNTAQASSYSGIIAVAGGFLVSLGLVIALIFYAVDTRSPAEKLAQQMVDSGQLLGLQSAQAALDEMSIGNGLNQQNRPGGSQELYNKIDQLESEISYLLRRQDRQQEQRLTDALISARERYQSEPAPAPAPQQPTIVYVQQPATAPVQVQNARYTAGDPEIQRIMNQYQQTYCSDAWGNVVCCVIDHGTGQTWPVACH